MPKDDDVKQAVLQAVLGRAAEEGFSDSLLKRCAAEVGGGDVARLFPQGVLSLIEMWSHQTDREMAARLKALDPGAMKVRNRIRNAVLIRLDVLREHKDAARRAASFLALPVNAPQAGKLVLATADAMWRAAADTSTDFNYYTKRAILAGVWSATLIRWFSDVSENEADTAAFLDARIGEVLQYEKLKAQIGKDAKAGWDRLSGLLRASRAFRC